MSSSVHVISLTATSKKQCPLAHEHCDAFSTYFLQTGVDRCSSGESWLRVEGRIRDSPANLICVFVEQQVP